MVGTLYLVGTPIGNLEDMTLRGIRVLKEVDIILCEDTRETLKLLNHFEIKTKMMSYHKYNEREMSGKVIHLLKEGKHLALVSDAGMPGISDPGEVLVQAAHEEGITPVVVPGPSALISGLAISGLPTRNFYFAGFFPKGKTKERRAFLEKLREIPTTLIFYTTPHSLGKDLSLIREVFGNVQGCITRELTKKFEEVIRGDVETLLSYSGEEGKKGEMVLLLDNTGYEEEGITLEEGYRLYQEKIKGGVSMKDGLKWIVAHYGFKKNEMYNYIISKEREEEDSE